MRVLRNIWSLLSLWGKLFFVIIVAYAGAGFFLTSVYFAIRLHLTDDPGSVTTNDRVFEARTGETVLAGDTLYNADKWLDLLTRVGVLKRVYPVNASQILYVFAAEQDPDLTENMLKMTEIYLDTNRLYQAMLDDPNSSHWSSVRNTEGTSLFPWANTIEWKTLRESLKKDKKRIDSVAIATGIEPRVLVSMLIGEQIRLFDSGREAFKQWISPLKILVNSTKISLGVMGIKEATAIQIENNLKDKQSVFYLGPECEHMLDFMTEDITTERFSRLTRSRDHTYPYLYAALYLRMVMQQWKRSGYDISGKVGLLGTLYNLGFRVSNPKPNPKVGGSRIMIDHRQYTFGDIAQEFYFSGELAKEFPY